MLYKYILDLVQTSTRIQHDSHVFKPELCVAEPGCDRVKVDMDSDVCPINCSRLCNVGSTGKSMLKSVLFLQYDDGLRLSVYIS